MASPGQIIDVSSEAKQGKGKWVGFARSETIEAVWAGWTPVDIKAEAFAEHNRPESRSSGTQVLTWGEVKTGQAIAGIGNRKTGEIRVITREATEEEIETCGHSRMPLLLEERF